MSNEKNLSSSAELEAFINAHAAAVVYFSSPGCGVCTVLKPKIRALLEREFPRAAFASVDGEAARGLAGQLGVFTVPTVFIFFEGREAGRFSRSFSVEQLRSTLERPYQMLFE